MVSDLFLKDYRQLSAQGVRFTPADIIRLNALAVRVRLSANPLSAAHVRRAVIFGGMAFREPTLGHEMWIERVGSFIDMAIDRNFRVVYAYALTRELSELPDPYKAERCVKAVFDFARKNLAAMTSAHLADILDYVLFGADWKACEMPPPKAKTDAEGECSETHSPALGVFIGAAARGIGLSLDDAKCLTASEVLEATMRADVMAKRFDSDTERNAALSAYVRAREEIRGRGCDADRAESGRMPGCSSAVQATS